MKTLFLGLAVALSFTANAQNLFIQPKIAMSEHKLREMVDIGMAQKHHRISLYVESFQTESFYNYETKSRNTGGYRKFFLGVRYARVIPIRNIVDLTPNVGIDIRLNGGNTKKTASQGIFGEVSNMPSMRTGIALEKQLSRCDPVLSHVKLFADAYSQLNAKLNSHKYVRTGFGTGIIITF